MFCCFVSSSSEDVDGCLWVIVGDIPPAYIVATENPTPGDALDAYIVEMTDWVEAAERGESVEELIPVNVPPSKEWAQLLRGRLEYLGSKILPLTEFRTLD